MNLQALNRVKRERDKQVNCYSGHARYYYHLLCAISLTAALPCLEVQGKDLIWNVEPTVRSIVSGEACILKLTFVNTGVNEIDMDLGYDRIGAYKFRITDATGNVVRSGGRKEGAGISRVSEINIQPNDEWTDFIILNRWCSTMLSPGMYYIRSECEVGSDQLKAESPIKIISESEADLTQAFANLLASPLTNFVYGDIMAIEVLAFTNNPQVIPYLEQALSMSRLTENIRLKVVAAYGGIEGVDSVMSLIRIIERIEAKEPASRLWEKGIQVLCKIHRTTRNPEIKGLTDAFFLVHPCLEEPDGFH